jgi:uncharacterized protein (TIGR02147 family)
MTNPVNEHIYEYENYRFFLRDYFVQQKKLRAIFSHRYFARRAGFSSSSFCAHVIEGKRNLTEKSLKKMLRGLGLTGRAATYIETLVRFNQAKSVEEREQCRQALHRLRKGTRFYKVNRQQFDYFEEWYYPVIRELAVYCDWGGDFSKLASLVRPSITPEKARKAVEALVRLGLIKENEDGSYAQTSELISVENIPVPLTRKTRRELIYRAVEAMETLPVDLRHISGCTVAMNEKAYRDVVEKLDDLREYILETALDCPDVDKVYQFNFQAFPLSRDLRTAAQGGSAENGGER